MFNSLKKIDFMKKRPTGVMALLSTMLHYDLVLPLNTAPSSSFTLRTPSPLPSYLSSSLLLLLLKQAL